MLLHLFQSLRQLTCGFRPVAQQEPRRQGRENQVYLPPIFAAIGGAILVVRIAGMLVH